MLSSTLCFDLKSRYQLLLTSKFTFLIDTPDLSVRLAESLRCSTIPVLIGLDTKLPLESLISWDEIVIRIPIERLNYLVPILESIDEHELARRQVKTRKIYTAYFSSVTQQIRTILAAVQWRLALPPFGMQSFIGIEFKIPINVSKSSNIYQENEEKYDGEDEESEAEFLGEINQTPIDSPQFTRNFTQSQYILWNEIFYPFNSFPSLPFEKNSILMRPYSIQSSINNYYLAEYLKVRMIFYILTFFFNLKY